MIDKPSLNKDSLSDSLQGDSGQRDPYKICQVLMPVCLKLSMTFYFIQTLKWSTPCHLVWSLLDLIPTLFSSLNPPQAQSIVPLPFFLCLETSSLEVYTVCALVYFPRSYLPQIFHIFAEDTLVRLFLTLHAKLPSCTSHLSSTLFLLHSIYHSDIFHISICLLSMSSPLEYTFCEGMDFLCFVHCIAPKPGIESDTQLELKKKKLEK